MKFHILIYVAICLALYVNTGCGASISVWNKKEFSSTIPSTSPTIASEFFQQFGTAGGLVMLAGTDIDSSGNIYVAGVASGSIGTSNQIGVYDGFLAKYSADGQLQWTAREGSAGGLVLCSRGRYVNGFFYVVGYTMANLDGQTLTGSADLFIVKYDSDGNRIWTRLLGDAAGQTIGSDLRVDSSGNVFVSAYTQGSFDGHARVGNVDALVVKYDTNGNKLWSQQIGSPAQISNGNMIGLDNSGNVYLGGVTIGTFDGHAPIGSIDGFQVQYDSNGVKQWSRTFGAPGGTAAVLDMVVDAVGNSYLAGYADADIDGQTHVGTKDQLVVKYDPAGNKQWTKLTGVAGKAIEIFSVKIDSTGRIVLGGGDNYNDASTYGWTIDRLNATTGATIDSFHDSAPGASSAIMDIHIDGSSDFVSASGMTTGGLSGNTQTGLVDAFVMRKKLN